MKNAGSENSVDLDTRLRLAPEVSMQSLGEDEGGVLLKMDSGEIFTINDTTHSFLKHADASRSIDDIRREMMLEFDVNEERLSDDLIEIAKQLISDSLVEIVAE